MKINVEFLGFFLGGESTEWLYSSYYSAAAAAASESVVEVGGDGTRIYKNNNKNSTYF